MLTGTLEEFALADVFRLVSLAKKTGTLHVRREAGFGAVTFQRGEVVMATSSLVRELIGQKLVRAGAVTEGQLRRALDEHASTGERVGRILVASGAVDPQTLEDAVRGQTEDAVFDLLRWERGDFEWETRATVDAEIPTAVSVENLIMEASRRLDELDIIRRKIPSEDAVVAMAVRPPEGAAEINITPEEWRLLVLVDGTRAVDDIAEALGSDGFTVLRTLYGLVSAGLVEVVSGDGAGGPERPVEIMERPASSEPFTIEPEDLQPRPPAPVDAEEEPVGERWGAEEPVSTAVEEPVSVAAEEPVSVASEQGEVEEPEPSPAGEPDLEPVGGAPTGEHIDESGAGASGSAGAAEDASVRNGDAATPPEPPAEPRLDRSAVVRELAGLFSETEPVAARPAGRAETGRADTGDEAEDEQDDRRKRVEDDDNITRGLISRFIDGVKGL